MEPLRFVAPLPLLVFMAVGVLIAWPSLGYPWYGDDLHLIRTFSIDELRWVWLRTWDLDGLESAGYRPLTVLFNHARSQAFGEAVVWHRLFLIALFAAYLELIGRVARRFRVGPYVTVLAGVLMLCAKYSSYHYLWISDGVHIAQGVLFALAALAILRWTETDSPGWLGASVLAVLVSVLVREDSLAILPVLAVLAAAYSIQLGRWQAQRRRLGGFALGLAAIAVAVLAARQAVLGGQAALAWMSVYEIVAHGVSVVTLGGWQWRPLLGLFVVVFVLAVAAVRTLPKADAQVAWMWLACTALSASPGIVESRVDLLFFPMTFYCLFLAQVAVGVVAGGAAVPLWGRGLAGVIIAASVVFPARESRLQQLSLAPGSLEHVRIDCELVAGLEWAAVTPPRRRIAASQSLAQFGLGPHNCEAFLGRSEWQPDQLPPGVFVPPRRFLAR